MDEGLEVEWAGSLYSMPTSSQEQPTGAASEFVWTQPLEEKRHISWQYACTRNHLQSTKFLQEEITNLEIDTPAAIDGKAPQISQWATLQELRLSSKLHYLKFLRITSNYLKSLKLTANDISRGIKMLRRMYGGPKGMLDTGITTFGNVLDGQEPQSLKEIFAFTCLSYVMSKLLQKHGKMDGSQVLADIDQWRLAIKKEKDRLVYDHVVKLLWPEIDFIKEHTEKEDTNKTLPLRGSYLSNIAPLDLEVNAASGNLYVTSSMLSDDTTASSNVDFLKRARDIDRSNIENDVQFIFQHPDGRLDPSNKPYDYGLRDHLMGLLHETSTHEDFMFADFLNFFDSQLEDNTGAAIEKQPPDIAPTRYLLARTQVSSPIELVTLDPKKLGNLSPPMAGHSVLFQTELPSPKADEVSSGLPSIGSLIETMIFQVVVEFIKFIASLGDLLFRLSGCGITSRRKEHEVEGSTRPVQQFGEFVSGAAKLVLEPIREDLGEIDESVDAVLSMADDFVRLGRLHTVREIEEYIITTARYLVCDYMSFITVISKTLKRCLAASDQMTWDHIYPSYTADQEEYSINYIRKTETIETEWALKNFPKNENGENNANLTTSTIIQTAKTNTQGRERSSSCNLDTVPTKKQRLSLPSPDSSNERQSSRTPASSSDGDLPPLSKAHCHYSNCNKSYNGKDARVNLRRHIRTVHEGCKAIKCPRCGHESSRRDNVRKHFLSQHKGEKVPAVLICKTRA